MQRVKRNPRGKFLTRPGHVEKGFQCNLSLSLSLAPAIQILKSSFLNFVFGEFFFWWKLAILISVLKRLETVLGLVEVKAKNSFIRVFWLWNFVFLCGKKEVKRIEGEEKEGWRRGWGGGENGRWFWFSRIFSIAGVIDFILFYFFSPPPSLFF